jgi:hypothetical protein
MHSSANTVNEFHLFPVTNSSSRRIIIQRDGLYEARLRRLVGLRFGCLLL